MRIAAIHLPCVRVELARARAGTHPPERERKKAPIAVVIARPGGAVKDERSLLGGTRLDEVSIEAAEQRVRRGETIAAARAKCAELLVRVVEESAVREVLQAVAEAALTFGRTASIDEARDVVCVDVTGCGHLFGGEDRLASELARRVEAMHVGPSRVAVADGPRVSAAIARALARAKSPVLLVPEGQNAGAIRSLPIGALPIDAGSIAWLRRLGLVRIGDLQRLPAPGLAMRLGAAHAEVMALLAGDDGAPLAPYVPPEVPEERAELEYGIESTEALLFVMKRLCDRLGARLAGRAVAAARLEVEASFDRALAREAGLPPGQTLGLTLSTPLSAPAELLAVARARVESWAIPAPILALTLRAPELARKEGRALDLFEAEAKADRALPRLVAELAAELGDERVGRLALRNTWVPEERSALIPIGGRARAPGGDRGPPGGLSLASLAPEPSRALEVPLVVEGLVPVSLLARVEAVEWWRLGVQARDFVAGWCEREQTMAWVEVDRVTGSARVKGWMD